MKNRLLSLSIALALIAPALVSGQGAYPSGGGSATTIAGHYVKTLQLSIAQVTALNSTPITALPAAAGYCYKIHSFMAYRTGARYATQPGTIALRFVASTPVANAALPATTLTSTTNNSDGTETVLITPAVGAASTIGNAAANVGGKAMDIFANTNNPTVDGTNVGSPVNFRIEYEMLPLAW